METKWWATAAADGVIEGGFFFPFMKLDKPYSKAPAVKVRVREKDLAKALATREFPESESSSKPVSESALWQFLLQEADGTRTLAELEQIATAHFAKIGKRFSRAVFRTVVKKIPAGKKLGRGEHARTRAARKRADNGS